MSVIPCFARYGLLLFLGTLGLLTCKQATDAPVSLPLRPLPGSTTFLALADWGVQGQFHQQEVADQMDRYAAGLSPAFVVMAGDNFYLKGVNSTTDPLWQFSFERVYKGAHLNLPFYAALGNHDYQQSPQTQIDYTKLSGRWQLPARYYTQVIGAGTTRALRLVVLDTNPFVTAYRQNVSAYPDILQDTGRQLHWADSVLAAAREPWTIVVGHHPIYSVGADHGDQPELVSQLQPLLAKYKVPLYLCGHSHTLQYLRPGGPTEYAVSGSGGAPLGTLADSTRATFARAIGGFAVISVNADSLRLNFVSNTGHVLFGTQRPRRQ